MIARVKMNHPNGKRLLASLRDGDFAHAKQPCAWPGNVCRNAQINLASTPDVDEVELRLSCNPSDGVRSWAWTLIRRPFPSRTPPTQAFSSSRLTSDAQENSFRLSSTLSMHSMLSMRFRISKLRSAPYVSLQSLKLFSAFLTTSTKEDSIKQALPENLRRCSGVRCL